ncbi:MAG TPA: hypothetical protein VFR36_00345 [Sphingomicrobium sp.]|nr:hypothetical protein [Sphingomicrobium sp.]
MKSKMPAFPARLPDGVRLDALAPAPADPAETPIIDFIPVPRRRNRRSGWTEERQRDFIAALARCGCVRAAARHVGLSPRNVYRLLDMEGADSFAAAWDQAQDIGRARLQADALARAMTGAFVPVYRRGRLVRVEYRRCDKLAIAMLGGGDKGLLAHSGAVSRRNHRADLRAVDAARAEVERQREEQRAYYDAELQEMIRRGEELLRARRQPRIRSL